MCESHRELPREESKRLPQPPVAEEFQYPKLEAPTEWTDGMSFLQQRLESAVSDEVRMDPADRNKDRTAAMHIATLAQAMNMENVPTGQQELLSIGTQVGTNIRAILGENQKLPSYLDKGPVH